MQALEDKRRPAGRQWPGSRGGLWGLICRERRGFDASRALHCVAKGERNTVRVLASHGNKMGPRTKLPKSTATLIFQPKMAMVGAP